MEDKQSFVFERNNYFTGKLLTAEDFRLEQDYFVNKRRFVNRLLYCGGIICGLQVKQHNQDTVAVNIGAAVDYQGREIVVAEPAFFKLDTREEQGYVYLCIGYDQEPSEDTAAFWDLKEGEQPFNKIREKYRLFWQKKENDEVMLKDKLNGDDLFWERKIVYKNQDFMITQCVPKYAQPNRFFEVKVDVVKFRKLTGKIYFSYQLQSACIKTGKGEDINIFFDEKLHVQSQEYNLRFSAVASVDMTAEADVKISSEKFTVMFNEKGLVAAKEPPVLWKIKKTETDVKNYLSGLYLEKDMESMLAEFKSFELYLAKVYYQVQNGACVITSIDNVPFGQYLDSWRLNKITQGVLSSQLVQGETITEEIVVKYLNQYKSEIAQYKRDVDECKKSVEECKKSIDKYQKEIDEHKKSSQETIINVAKMVDMQPKMASGIAELKVDWPKVVVDKLNRSIEGLIQLNVIDGPDTYRTKRIEELCNLQKSIESSKISKEMLSKVKEYLPQPMRLRSEPIFHGLGTGYAQISFNIIERLKDNVSFDLSGSSVKFWDKDYSVYPKPAPSPSTVDMINNFANEINARINNMSPKFNATLNTKDGSFVMEAVFNEWRYLEKITVAWSAYKESESDILKPGDTFKISPGICKAVVQKPVPLTCYFNGKRITPLEWQVTGSGAKIGSDGVFTASGGSSVYEVKALYRDASIPDCLFTASAFVIVI